MRGKKGQNLNICLHRSLYWFFQCHLFEPGPLHIQGLHLGGGHHGRYLPFEEGGGGHHGHYLPFEEGGGGHHGHYLLFEQVGGGCRVQDRPLEEGHHIGEHLLFH